MRQKPQKIQQPALRGYSDLLADISGLLEDGRRQAARSVNAVLTATYWYIGRRVVEFEQKGKRNERSMGKPSSRDWQRI